MQLLGSYDLYRLLGIQNTKVYYLVVVTHTLDRTLQLLRGVRYKSSADNRQHCILLLVHSVGKKHRSDLVDHRIYLWF